MNNALLLEFHFEGPSFYYLQIMYLGHPEGAVDEMIGLTNESIMSELIDGVEADDDNRPG